MSDAVLNLVSVPDLPSTRVEALQLGDCVQEMALISRLTEGSRVFLSREENQHFIKELVTNILTSLLSK